VWATDYLPGWEQVIIAEQAERKKGRLNEHVEQGEEGEGGEGARKRKRENERRDERAWLHFRCVSTQKSASSTCNIGIVAFDDKVKVIAPGLRTPSLLLKIQSYQNACKLSQALLTICKPFLKVIRFNAESQSHQSN
jgi:hypothetical protein